MNCDLDTSIPDWIIEYPQTTAVFDELGLDVGCAGKSLRYVCLHHDLNPTDVLEKLEATINPSL